MPTSSQALILYKNVPGRQASHTQQNRDLAQYSVAGIYNLSGCMPLSSVEVKDQHVIRVLGRDSAQLFKYHDLPRGYTSILSFDEVANGFRWEAIGGTYTSFRKDEKRISFSSSLEDQSTPATGTPVNRPHSSFTRPKSSKKCQVNQIMFDKLVGLGFRGSDLEVDSTLPQRTQSGPSGFTNRFPKRTSSATCRPTSAKQSDQIPKQEPSKYIHKQEDEEEERNVSDNNDVEDDGPDVDDEQNRIKPSIYMRKDTPLPMPTAGVLSFRDNECFSHADVKYLIETQLGIRVKSIQYDPLNVRVCRDDVRCRWIVNFMAGKDLEKAVKNGLVVGKDKIIVYRYDDIAKREVSSFKYFMTIQEAKKKLKSTKSWKTLKVAKVMINLRGTRSNKV